MNELLADRPSTNGSLTSEHALQFVTRLGLIVPSCFMNQYHGSDQTRSGINIVWDGKDKLKQFQVSSDWSSHARCPQQYIVSFLSSRIESEAGGHSCLLMLDKRRHHAYYFDPLGSNLTRTFLQQTIYEQLFLPLHLPYEFIQVEQQGPQNEETNMCQVWTLCLFTLRMLNPKESYSSLVHYLSSQPNEYIYRFLNYVETF